jgi:hypothetical protein
VLATDDQPVILATKLDADSLHALAAGNVDVLWHKAYYPLAACNAALPAIRSECSRSSYTLTSDLQSLGTSVGEAAENTANEQRYFDTALDTARLIRSDLFEDRRSPIDCVRLDIDEIWPYGAALARRDTKPMLSGIIRRWTAGGHANPHIDQRQTPVLTHLSLIRRLGVNVYISVPGANQGGEIQFWGKVLDEQEYGRAKRSDYGLDRSLLSAPLLVIEPGVGDLIAFEASRIHSVESIKSGDRVTAACFLGITALDERIHIFA